MGGVTQLGSRHHLAMGSLALLFSGLIFCPIDGSERFHKIR